MDTIIINITERPVDQVTQNIETEAPDHVTIYVSSPDSVPRGGSVGQVLAKAGTGDYSTAWVTIPISNVGAQNIAFGDINGVVTGNSSFQIYPTYASIHGALIGQLTNESFIQGTGYDKFTIYGVNSGAYIDIYGNSHHIDYTADKHNFYGSKIKLLDVVTVDTDGLFYSYPFQRAFLQINDGLSQIGYFSTRTQWHQFEIDFIVNGVNVLTLDDTVAFNTQTFSVHGGNGKAVITGWQGVSNDYPTLYLLPYATAPSSSNFILTSDGPNTYLNAPSGSIRLKVAGTTVSDISSSAVSFSAPNFSIDNHSGGVLFFGQDGGIDYLSLVGNVGPVLARGLYSNLTSYTAFNSPDVLYLLVKATPVFIASDGGSTVIYDSDGFLHGYTSQITLGAHTDPIDYYNKNYHNFRGNVTINDNLTVYGTISSSGNLYINAGANVFMQGGIASFASDTRLNSKVSIDSSGALFPTAGLDINSNERTSAYAALRLRPMFDGSDPSTLNDGDVWVTGTAIKIRLNGVTKTFNLT